MVLENTLRINEVPKCYERIKWKNNKEKEELLKENNENIVVLKFEDNYLTGILHSLNKNYLLEDVEDELELKPLNLKNIKELYIKS